MANNSGEMTPDEARAALDDVAHDGAALAARVVTPWWYHPTLGLIVGVFVVAQVLPGAWSIAAVALGIIAIPVLTTTYARRYGVAISKPAGPRGRRLMLTALVVLVACMLSGLTIRLVGLESGWALIPVIVAFAATVILGRRFDEALRRELSATSIEPA
ncbi:hypothetical protein PUW81_003485 [Microbacterium sp. NM3R9]|uniref:hypothetical protein n=1 Tax=Microbacterium thalli TaxID=3027921 RepID=UPI002365BA64|nr:hypothetical protein [Microbacterium thalli]MDD7928017.1 hypothetical protein [Microbacterium thalli]MDN8548163.1 hypothetical protein [Microbacterium thalli]